MQLLPDVLVFLLCSLSLQGVAANVEKIIFVAPEALTAPQDASIDNLLLTSLNPDHFNLRTYLNASFPTDEKSHGEDTWVLLDGLTPGRRYELRVCWLATQPTSFWIYTHALSSVFESADLITSLSLFSYAKHAQLTPAEVEDLQQRRFRNSDANEASMLFLQIQAAADYFTMNKTLMEHVPPVHVDLILDPYLLNVFPRSLLPTAGYVAIVAISAWSLSGWVFRKLSRLGTGRSQEPVTTERKTQ